MKRFSIAIIALVLIGYLMISVDSADPDESEFHYYYSCERIDGYGDMLIYPLVYRYKDHLKYSPEDNPDGWNLIEEDDFGWTYQTVSRYGNTKSMYIEKSSNRIRFYSANGLANCKVEKTLSKK